MKKKTIVILSLVAIVSAVLCIGSCIKNPTTEVVINQTSKEAGKTKILNIDQLTPDLYEKFVADERLTDNHKQIINSVQIAKSGTELTYKETANYSEEIKLDIYVDSNQNEYKYNSDGDIIGFSANAMAVDTITGTVDKGTLTLDDAKALAPKYARAFFGDKMNGFEIYSAKYNDSLGVYSVDFTKLFGEGGFIRGPYCFVDILPNGALKSCMLSRYDIYSDFDFDRLNGITQKTVTDFVDSKIKSGATYEINYISLVKEQNSEEFYIEIGVAVTDADGWASAVDYKYELT